MNKIILLIASFLALGSTLSSQTLILCDKGQGISYLSTDPMDGFYDRVTSLEIAIQLKNDSLDLTDRAGAIDNYRSSYNDEVVSINEIEAETLKSMFTGMFKSINTINDELLPDTIRMILVNGNHYGASTFFTRGNAIIASRASLADMDPTNFERVMYHELSHVIARFHPTLKDELYGHLGFEKIDASIMIERDFYDRILYNPDGVKIDYAIPLMMPDSNELFFVPVIFTMADHFDSKNPTFFSYLNFQLIPIDKVGDVYFLRNLAASSELNMGYVMKQYFETITMNTQYIIHPDELLADNFMYLFRAEEENKDLDMRLLNSIQNSLSSFQK